MGGFLIGLLAGLKLLPPSEGALEVLSDPPGASAFVCDVFRGVTPVTLEHLPVGPLPLRLSRSGHEEASRTVSVNRGRNSVRVRLSLRPVTAALMVRSDPPGASVWLDGQRGPETPARFEALPPGQHSLRIERAGSVPHETSIELSPGQEAVIAVRLLSAKAVYYRDAIRRQPEDPTNYVELGRVLVRNAEMDEAFEILARAIETYGRSGRGLDKGFAEFLSAMRQAEPALDDGHWPALFRKLVDGVRAGPLDERIAGVLDSFLSSVERWSEVVALAGICVDKGGAPATHLLRRALAAARMKDSGLFRKDFQRVMEIWSGQPSVSCDRVLLEALGELRRWEEIVQYCDLLLASQPGQTFAVFCRLEALARLKRQEDFEREKRRLVEQMRQGVLGLNEYLLLRPILIELGRRADLADFCEACFPPQARGPQALFWLLEAHYLKGDWRETERISSELLAHGIEPPGRSGPLGFQPNAAIAVLWAAAWSRMELGDQQGLGALLVAYEGQKGEHYWVDAVRGEAWRRRPEGDPPKRWLDVPRTDRAPGIDGRLDDEAWQRAGRSSRFFDLYTNAEADGHTTLYTAYDGVKLYIGIRGEQVNVSRPPPMAFDRYPNQRLELFLDPRCSYMTYKQFMFGADGFRRELDCFRGPFDHAFHVDDGWDVPYELAVQNDGETQSFELAVAFSSLDVECPVAGTVWGFNLVHLGARSVTFVPIGSDFHGPGRFAFLRFLK
ncbi:MAG: PEGA domain-containing protein [Planctomycetes bacterium]|nr:PEGA domain-containing protein [Planctomycetota bacterium]